MIKIKLERWPWQERKAFWTDSNEGLKRRKGKYGWRPIEGMGRFGGGWNYSLGLKVSSASVHIDLLFGSIRITLKTRKVN